MHSKFKNLQNYLNNLEKQGICLAFSGGIDSILLLYLCKDLNILAVTINSNLQTEEEINFTKQICSLLSVRQVILDIDIFQNPLILSNPKDRCYHCKKMMFEKIIDTAGKNRCNIIIDGTNFDDLKVYRPGRKALDESGVISPFAKFEITKNEIREYAKNLGITHYNKPSAPCLATRFPYGTNLTNEKLQMVELGEKILKQSGFSCCRLRIHNEIARIEINPEFFQEFLSKRTVIITALKNIGLKYITLDIEGFRSGSMDL